MIREIKGKGKILFISRELLNSIVRWICGVHSPDGSVVISNTPDPKTGGPSLGLSVNLPSIASRVKKMIFGNERPLVRQDIRDMIRNSADGNSIKANGSNLSVNAEWLSKMIDTIGQDDGSEENVEDHTDQNQNDGTGGSAWQWSRGGKNLVLSCYCEIGIDDGGYHHLAHVNLLFSKDGRLTRAIATGETKKVYA